jgi:hypothetical protein
VSYKNKPGSPFLLETCHKTIEKRGEIKDKMEAEEFLGSRV